MTIDELYGEFFDELVSWCAAMCGDETAAEDMVQEAFARALSRSDTLEKLHPLQSRAWLYTTIKNIYLDRVRHSAFETVAEENAEIADICDDYDMSEIKQLLDALPDIEGMLFKMRYLYGYNSKELGSAFNMPAGTVRYKLSSARRRLKEMLEEGSF